MEWLHQARVLVRGAGELGSGVAAHLARQGFGRVLMVERAFPKAVRRNVCFSEAVFNHAKTVDGVTARFVMLLSEVDLVHELGDLAITTQPLPEVLAAWPPDILVDAAMQRANWGLSRELARRPVSMEWFAAALQEIELGMQERATEEASQPRRPWWNRWRS